MFKLPDDILQFQILPFLDPACDLKLVNKKFNNIDFEKYCTLIQPHGIVEEYHWKTKNMLTRYSYVNGKEHGLSESWFDDGLQRWKCNFKNGKMNGLNEIWYPNGQQKCKDNYQDDKFHGVCEGWYVGGAQLYKWNFQNGMEYGLQETWEENGLHKYREEFC